MKNLLTICLLLLSVSGFYAQLKVGDNPTTIDASALLELESTTQGLLVPRMTTVQRTVITNPALGLMVFDTDLNQYMINKADATHDWAALLDDLSTASLWTLDGTNIYNSNNNNVGIGVKIPSEKLHVAENTGANIMLSRDDATTANNNLLGQILFESTDDAISTTDASVMIRAYASEAHSASDKGGFLTFETKPTDTDENQPALERMRIEDNGFVGIGATTPGGKLEVQSDPTTANENGILIDQNRSSQVLSGTKYSRGLYTDIDINNVTGGAHRLYGHQTSVSLLGTSQANQSFGNYNYLQQASSGTVSDLRGVYNSFSNTGTGSITNIRGFANNFAFNTNSGDVGTIYGTYTQGTLYTPANFTNIYGTFQRFYKHVADATGSVTNFTGTYTYFNNGYGSVANARGSNDNFIFGTNSKLGNFYGSDRNLTLGENTAVTGIIQLTRNRGYLYTTTNLSSVYGTDNVFYKHNATSTGTITNFIGTRNYINHNNGVITNLTGTYNHFALGNNATVGNVYFNRNYGTLYSNNNYGNVFGNYNFFYKHVGTGNIPSFFANYARLYHTASRGTITNAYLYYGTYSPISGDVTHRYGVYMTGEDKNYFSGNIGVNTTNPTANLSVNGTANKIGGGTWAVFSDRRIKTNVRDYPSALDKIKKVRVVEYDYKSDYIELMETHEEYEEEYDDQGELIDSKMVKKRVNVPVLHETQVGIIAQEVKEIFPRSVHIKETNYLKDQHEFDANELNFALIKALQELSEIVEKQQREIDELKKGQ